MVPPLGQLSYHVLKVVIAQVGLIDWVFPPRFSNRCMRDNRLISEIDLIAQPYSTQFQLHYWQLLARPQLGCYMCSCSPCNDHRLTNYHRPCISSTCSCQPLGSQTLCFSHALVSASTKLLQFSAYSNLRSNSTFFFLLLNAYKHRC